jgi:carotenoid cleavage dioxygenase-like enzyme
MRTAPLTASIVPRPDRAGWCLKGRAMIATTTLNPYLSGNFAPVSRERDDNELEVTGAIPPEINGLLLRNGPNPVVMPDPAAYHWFQGDGMLHGIELADGRARYRNRWVRTPQACAALGEPAPPGPPEANGLPSVANTSVVAHAGRLYALVESSLPTEVRPDLSTVGAFDFDGRLRGSFTAHPKFDTTTGEMLIFGYDMFKAPYVTYHVVDAAGQLVRSVGIDIPGPVMMHTFAVTSTRIVWLDLPVVFDLDLVGQRPFPFIWRPEHGARVGVMSRDDPAAAVTWIDIDPCYVFHDMNAYDRPDGNIALDVVVWPDMFATDLYGTGSSSANLERWTIDPSAGTVLTRRLDDVNQEFPRINDLYQGRPYRYGYSTGVDIGATWFRVGALQKYDLTLERAERHDVGPGRAAGEPVFVPASDSTSEDAGWIVSVVYDASRDASDVIVVDATNFSAPPVATIHLPERVPFGFHGSWLSDRTLG